MALLPWDAAGYAAWLERHGRLTGADRQAIAAQVARMGERPRFLLVPLLRAGESPADWAETLRGALSQLYPEWRLCLPGAAGWKGCRNPRRGRSRCWPCPCLPPPRRCPPLSCRPRWRRRRMTKPSCCRFRAARCWTRRRCTNSRCCGCATPTAPCSMPTRIAWMRRGAASLPASRRASTRS
ncbi:hypothetical protein [Teichococcus aestuarii]|uniref:hypothetical protein n=1 Tax=Teichococcus aestuarii TaxID=568898 RepID=UPI003613A575